MAGTSVLAFSLHSHSDASASFPSDTSSLEEKEAFPAPSAPCEADAVEVSFMAQECEEWGALFRKSFSSSGGNTAKTRSSQWGDLLFSPFTTSGEKLILELDAVEVAGCESLDNIDHSQGIPHFLSDSSTSLGVSHWVFELQFESLEISCSSWGGFGDVRQRCPGDHGKF